jgi:hypothetical protein
MVKGKKPDLSGALKTARKLGLDLVQVSVHQTTCSQCARIQGKVFTITGKTQGFPLLSSVTPLHEGCRHNVLPYVPVPGKESELEALKRMSQDSSREIWGYADYVKALAEAKTDRSSSKVDFRFMLLALGVCLSAVMPLGLSGCVMFPQARLSEKHDEFTGDVTARLDDNVLDGGMGLSSNGRVEFNPVRSQGEKDSSPIYCIAIVYTGYGTGWCFIEPGESLYMIIDGKREALSGTGSRGSREVSGGAVSEVSVYPVDPELLRRIASAKEVRVKIEGSKQSLERSFSQKNISSVGQFVASYVDATTAMAPAP